jgi:hypothetical protein
MNLLNKIIQIFKGDRQPAQDDLGYSQESDRWFEGFVALKNGKEHYFSEPMRAQDALASFDVAINCGFQNAEVHGLRGSCLGKLHF